MSKTINYSGKRSSLNSFFIGFLFLMFAISFSTKVFSQCTTCASCTTVATNCTFSTSVSTSQNFSFKSNSGGRMCILGGTYSGNVTIIGGNNTILIVVAPGAVFAPASITYGVFINGSFTLEVQQGGTAILPPMALGFNGSVNIRNCGVINCTAELLLPGTGTGNGSVNIQNNGKFNVAGTLRLGTNGGRNICNSDSMHLGSFVITGNISGGVTNNGYIEVDTAWNVQGSIIKHTLCPSSLIKVKGNWIDNGSTVGSYCAKMEVGGNSVCNNCKMSGVWDFCDNSGAAATKSYPIPKVDTIRGSNPSWAPSIAYCTSCVIPVSAPTVFLNDTRVCEGSCVNLIASVSSGTPPYTYNWSPSIGTASGPVSVCPTITTTYTLVVTDQTGVTGSATSQVTVDLLPVVAASPNAILCKGLTTNLSASGGGTYSWSPSNGLSNPAISNPVANPTATTTYTVTVTDAIGCSNSATVTVTVADPPTTTISHSKTLGCDSNTIYIGYGPQSITFTVNSSSTLAAYQWYLNGVAIPGGTAQNFSASASGIYNVIVTDVNGCISGSSVSSIKINVIDVRCGHDLRKVMLCHAPPRNHGRAHTICIGREAISSHLRNHAGDCIGSCNNSHRIENDDNSLAEEQNYNLSIYPNPFTEETTIDFYVSEGGRVSLQIYDLNGALVKNLLDKAVEEDSYLNVKVDGSSLAEGIYIVTLHNNNEVIHQKLVLTK